MRTQLFTLQEPSICPSHFCSDTCVTKLDLKLCSTTGFANGFVKDADIPAAVCTSKDSCKATEQCDKSNPTPYAKVTLRYYNCDSHAQDPRLHAASPEPLKPRPCATVCSLHWTGRIHRGRQMHQQV